MNPEPARVVLYTRPGCHLCDVARSVVASVCEERRATWTETNVEDDEQLLQRFRDEIPVTFVDGRQHDFWRVDPRRLRAALASVPPA